MLKTKKNENILAACAICSLLILVVIYLTIPGSDAHMQPSEGRSHILNLRGEDYYVSLFTLILYWVSATVFTLIISATVISSVFIKK